MKIALNLLLEKKNDLKLARQIGVKYSVRGGCKFGGADKPWKLENLKEVKRTYQEENLSLIAYENLLPPEKWREIILDRPNREEEIERFCQALKNLGKLNIPIASWNWDSYIWSRASSNLNGRGESLVTGYNHQEMKSKKEKINVDITEEELWESLEKFLERVIPVAEEAGVKMALHPDDPPLPTVMGIPHIVNSVEAFDKILNLYPSENHGINFCQGCFSLMDINIPETIRHFGEDIVFAHFRDVKGNAKKFQETWHDNGPHDMKEIMRAYYDIDFEGPIRPDHVPTMAVEDNENPGYEIMGRLFAVGYMKGLIECVEKNG